MAREEQVISFSLEIVLEKEAFSIPVSCRVTRAQ
jgi:hypothetical protein